MDDGLSGTDHSWFKYFPNAVKSVLSCRSQNVTKTTQDILYVICYFKPDLTSYRHLLTVQCWLNGVVLTAAGASCLLWLIKYGCWWLTGFSTGTYCNNYFGKKYDNNDDWNIGSEVDSCSGAGGNNNNDRDERCEVKCEVLYDPGPQSALVDVVFIHGLRGDNFKTWKQGVWKQAGQKPEPVVVRSSTIATTTTTSGRSSSGPVDDREQLERLATDDREQLERLATDDREQLERVATDDREQLERVATDDREQLERLATDDREQLERLANDDREQLERLATDEEIKEFTNCWPRDWLPLDCPYVRVITISYSTDPYLWRPIWLSKPDRTTMKDRGLEMISLLKDFHVGHNPITWVGHSKGGLFIKQILMHATENQKTHQIITNTRGILFYSVPHNGSPLANIKFPFFQRSIELQELVNDTQDIQILQKTFHELMNRNRQIQVKSFIETKLTLMKLIYLRIVSIQSADPGFGDLYGVSLDHRNICKPKNRNCFLYQELVNMIHPLRQLTTEETA